MNYSNNRVLPLSVTLYWYLCTGVAIIRVQHLLQSAASVVVIVADPLLDVILPSSGLPTMFSFHHTLRSNWINNSGNWCAQRNLGENYWLLGGLLWQLVYNNRKFSGITFHFWLEGIHTIQDKTPVLTEVLETLLRLLGLRRTSSCSCKVNDKSWIPGPCTICTWGWKITFC